MVVMKYRIANWELSGMRDGGHYRDCDDDEECVSGYCKGYEKFGSISGPDHTPLSNCHAFFKYSQTYVLYAWHMLEKHGLL